MIPRVSLVVVQLLSRVQLFVTPWPAALQASLSITISLSLLKFISNESVMPSSHLTLCRPLLLLPPTLCLFNFYAEYIVRNAGLEETQAWIKNAGRNINNLRCADDTTLMAESEEELKSLLMKVKEESEKVGLKLNIQKMIMASGPFTSWEIDGETGKQCQNLFWGLQNHCRWWLQPWN